MRHCSGSPLFSRDEKCQIIFATFRFPRQRNKNGHTCSCVCTCGESPPTQRKKNEERRDKGRFLFRYNSPFPFPFFSPHYIYVWRGGELSASGVSVWYEIWRFFCLKHLVKVHVYLTNIVPKCFLHFMANVIPCILWMERGQESGTEWEREGGENEQISII